MSNHLRLLRLSRSILVLSLTILCAAWNLIPAEVSAQETNSSPFRIGGVEIVGNRLVDTAAIKTQLKYTSGEVTAKNISEDVKTLYATGYFDQVTAEAGVSGSDSSLRVLRYLIVEKPTVRKVYIKGNKAVSESDLSSIFTFDTRRFLDKAKVDSLMRTAITFYQTRGYYDAKFEYSVVPAGENQVDLTFTVTEGTKYKIRTIEFRGLSTLDESELRSAIQTSTYSWWSSWILGTGRLNKDMLENDRQLLRQYFLDHGFLDGTASEALIEKEGDGGLKISFELSEGQEYKIGKITASGDLISESVEATLKGVQSQPGEVFSASTVREDAFRVSDRFTDIGYAFANVVPDTQVQRGTQTVDLDFATSKGNLVSVNHINISGNEKTYDNVIRRELKIQEQDLYSSSKIRRSQALLQRLGYFEEVNISSEPSQDKNKVDLNVNVREGSTGTFSAGAGYSSSDGAIFNARLAEQNIFGTGRSASVNVDVGSERDNIVFSLEDRRVDDSHLSLGGDILRTNREFSDFDRRLMGAAVTAGYPLEEVLGESFDDIAFSTKYEYLDINISNIDTEDAAQLVIDSEGTSTSSSVTPRLIRNTINNPLNPTEGSRQTLAFEMAGLGGAEKFFLLDFRSQLYHPLVKSSYGDLVFSWRFGVGYGDSFDDDPFPLFRRFFPGGINSVRGYKNRTMGPKDANGHEFGGSKELINTFEVIFPLINSAGLKGVVFYDSGEAFDDNQSIDLGSLRAAYGYGIRWTSPLGPIRIEFGFPLDKEEGDSSMVTLFSFGAPL